MTERQMVTLRKITELREIPDAEFIETAVIDGWTVVVKKGEFEADDECVFFEIDSFLPATDARFAFLEKTKRVWRGKEGYRLKTIKLRKQLSQGLALPLGLFSTEITAHIKNIVAGAISILKSELPTESSYRTLADLLGVLKWEEDENNNGGPNGPGRLSTFPSFIPKTDQERIQNVHRSVAGTCGEVAYEVTVKMDGSSITVYHKDDHVGVCSRNQELKLDEDNNFVRAARESRLLYAIDKLGKNYAVQGELCGPGIQKNRAEKKELGIWIFDIYDIDERRYLLPDERHQVYGDLRNIVKDSGVAPALDFRHVPVLATGYCRDLAVLDNALALAERATYVIHQGDGTIKEVPAEGVVFKPALGGDSFKIISNSYLMKHDL